MKANGSVVLGIIALIMVCLSCIVLVLYNVGGGRESTSKIVRYAGNSGKLLFAVSIILIAISLIFTPTPVKFQHSDAIITDQALKYVRDYKKKLLQKLVDVFNKFNIRYIITCGNLLEIYRNSPIIQDDDIDIIFHYEDFPKWQKYCLTLKPLDDKYTDGNGLIFDKRAKNFEEQAYNGIQIFLDETKMDIPDSRLKGEIHADVIISKHSKLCKYWAKENWHIGFSEPLRKVLYMDIPVYIPSLNNTIKQLKFVYGKDFETPRIVPKKIGNTYFKTPRIVPKKIFKKTWNNLILFIVINMDKNKERWGKISSSLEKIKEKYNCDYIRISGVDGFNMENDESVQQLLKPRNNLLNKKFYFLEDKEEWIYDGSVSTSFPGLGWNKNNHRGTMGLTMSNIKCFDEIKKYDHKYNWYCILEDDSEIDEKIYNEIIKITKNDKNLHDVIILDKRGKGGACAIQYNNRIIDNVIKDLHPLSEFSIINSMWSRGAADMTNLWDWKLWAYLDKFNIKHIVHPLVPSGKFISEISIDDKLPLDAQ